MSNDTHHHHFIPQVSFSIGEIEFKVTGYSAEDATKIIKDLIKAESEEKSEVTYSPTINVSLPDNGHNFDPDLEIERYTLIEGLDDLEVGDIVVSINRNAGGYWRTWPQDNMRGVVAGIGERSHRDGKPIYIDIEAPDGSVLAFDHDDMVKDFLKVESVEKTQAPSEPDRLVETIASLYQLQEGDRVEATVNLAGGFRQWRKGRRGVVVNTNEPRGVWIELDGEDHQYWFTDEEITVFQQIAKVVE